MKNEIKDLLDGIHDHLEYQKMMGAREIPKRACHCACPPPPKADQPLAEVVWRKAPKVAWQSPEYSLAQGIASSQTPRNDTKLASIKTEIGNCTRCKLHSGRHTIVFGVGNPCAELMFVGEGPGADEDAQGEPFVGRAGQLLNKIIAAMKMRREDVYITNIVMCRPPNNRNPEPDEMQTCMPFLLKRIAVIQPKIIVCLGAIATKALLNTDVPISKMRGKLIDFPPLEKGGQGGFKTLKPCKLLPTYHPAFLLRNPNMKRPVWEDMQVAMKELKG